MTEINLHHYPAPGAADAYAWAELVARRRYARTLAANRAARGQPANLDADLDGMFGETAVACYFGARLDDVTMAGERRRGYDVAGFQVRSTRYSNGGLRINTDEVAGRFVLAITQYAQRYGTVRLAGWIDAVNGRRRGVVRVTGGIEPWIRVDQADLYPLDDRAEPVS